MYVFLCTSQGMPSGIGGNDWIDVPGGQGTRCSSPSDEWRPQHLWLVSTKNNSQNNLFILGYPNQPKGVCLTCIEFFYYILQVVRRQGTKNWKAFPIPFLNCLFNCCFRLLLCLLFLKVVKLFYCVSGCFFVLFCSVVVLGCPFGLRVRPSYHRETTRQPYPPCPPSTTSPISVTTPSSWTAWLSPSSVMDITHRPWLCFRG